MSRINRDAVNDSRCKGQHTTTEKLNWLNRFPKSLNTTDEALEPATSIKSGPNILLSQNAAPIRQIIPPSHCPYTVRLRVEHDHTEYSLHSS